jgi:hypothetical protein
MSADSKEIAETSGDVPSAEQNKKKKQRAEGRPHKRESAVYWARFSNLYTAVNTSAEAA